jgi:hypothetical protein
MLEPKRSQWWDSAMLGAAILYLTTGLLLSVHLSS